MARDGGSLPGGDEAAARAMRRRLRALLLAAAVAGAPDMTFAAASGDPHAEQRRRMVDEIVAMARAAARETGRPELAPRTLEAMRRVPRHRFTAESDSGSAYENRPLAIGLGQTISQPYIVALMTDLLALAPGERVLEIGTGSGYQAAVLAELGAQVYTVEIVEPLARAAAQRLAELGYRNVATRVGDGYEGWAEHAPYDAVIVTAAAPDVPAALIAQLKPGGRMAIPVGRSGGVQMLQLVRKRDDGKIDSARVLDVRFVPFTGKGSTAPPR